MTNIFFFGSAVFILLFFFLFVCRPISTKIKIVKTIGLGCLSIIFIFIFGIISMVIFGNEYIIPEESSILQFRALQMNTGSWDGWIYGEDDRYYYYAGNHDYDAVYVMFPKKKIKECDGFDPINFSTWCKEYVLMPGKKSFIGK